MSLYDFIDDVDLKASIDLALEKIGSLHKLHTYIPMENGTKMHHKTFVKILKSDPERAKKLIEDYILNSDPKVFPGMKRSGKLKFTLSDSAREKIIKLASKEGDFELVNELLLIQNSSLKKVLISLIRDNKEIPEMLLLQYRDLVSRNREVKEKRGFEPIIGKQISF